MNGPLRQRYTPEADVSFRLRLLSILTVFLRKLVLWNYLQKRCKYLENKYFYIIFRKL